MADKALSTQEGNEAVVIIAKQYFGTKVCHYIQQGYGIKQWKNLLECYNNQPDLLL